MQEIIKLAREMGKAIQQTKQYEDMLASRKACDEDQPLQQLIEQFGTLGEKMEAMSEDNDVDENALGAVNDEMMGIYEKIMSNINMRRFYAVKEEVDHTMNTVVAILSASLDGEDPMTFEPEHEHSCSGDCSGCHGCH